jgi:hypothetical protein
VKACIDLSDPANSESGNSWLGLGPPLVIGIGSMLLGVLLMLSWRATGHREFFARRPEVIGRAELAATPTTGPEG